jgi:hypothetical protein
VTLARYCVRGCGRNPRPSGPCEHRGQPIESPKDLSYHQRLTWALDHSLADAAITAARVLGVRRARSAAEPPRRAVTLQRDRYLAAEALRSLVAVEGVEATRPPLREPAASGSLLLQGAASSELVRAGRSQGDRR